MPTSGARLRWGPAAPCSWLAVGQGHRHLSLARAGDLGLWRLTSGAKAMPREGRGRRGHPRAGQVHSALVSQKRVAADIPEPQFPSCPGRVPEAGPARKRRQTHCQAARHWVNILAAAFGLPSPSGTGGYKYALGKHGWVLQAAPVPAGTGGQLGEWS